MTGPVQQERLELALWRTLPVAKRALMEICGMSGAMEDAALIEDLRTVVRNLEEVLKPTSLGEDPMTEAIV